jgi:hypothetical protein
LIPDAKKLFSGVNAPLMPTFTELYDYLVKRLKCHPSMKTIYVSFSLKGDMVASAHPQHGQAIELALALPVEHKSELLYDASHLKWRTLPVAVKLTTPASLKGALPLMEEAARRVRTGEHSVSISNQRFAAKTGGPILKRRRKPRSPWELPPLSE